MSEDVTKEMQEILDRSHNKQKDQGAQAGVTVGDINGNGNTVVIGGNVNQGRREEDKPGASDESHGRRASDHALHQELRQLRQQVHHLKQLVTDLYECCNLNTRKRPSCPAAACLTSSGSTGASQVNVSNHRPPASTIQKIAESLGMRGFRSHQPIPTHINPGISFLLAPNNPGRRPGCD